MRVFLGTDHAGYELKEHLLGWLKANGYDAVDCGAFVYDEVDDYPPFILRAAERTVAEPGSLGIVIGGSGNGEQIAANKVKGARAALVWNEDTAVLARQHNDANIISIGSRQHDAETATRFVQLFLETPYSKEKRHTRRIKMISGYEHTGEVPPLPREG